GPGFTGHVADAGSRLVYMQQRYYDPSIGRFISRDPVPSDHGSNFARYTYARANPISHVDPDGRFAVPWHGILTYVAARRSGLSLFASIRHAFRAMHADFEAGSQDVTPVAAAIHAMRVAGQDVGNAERLNSRLVHDAISRGDLGLAAHAVQDRHAGGHHGFAEWNGFREMGFIESLKHLLRDIFPKKQELSDALRDTEEVFDAASEDSSQGDGRNASMATDLPWKSGQCGPSLVVGCNSWTSPLPTNEPHITPVRRQ
ncbi:RHS repeat-associated core domain-containing protein, partial [Arenimonas composti]